MGFVPFYFLLIAFIFAIAKERRFSLVPTALLGCLLAYVVAVIVGMLWIFGAAAFVLVVVLTYASAMGIRRFVQTRQQFDTIERDLRQELARGSTAPLHKAR
jgi:hypothetical protein